MTKRKENKIIQSEKLIHKALVENEKQPYIVPNNWCWVYLNAIYSVNPKNNLDDELEAAFIPMEKIEPGYQSSFSYDVKKWGEIKKNHTHFANGDVAFAKISPSFENRKSMVLKKLPNGIGAGTTELIVLRQSKINPHYTYWYFSREDFIRRGVVTYSGVVGQQRIDMDFVRNYPVPLPPLAEQQRIVDRIESLFAKLNEAEIKLQVVLGSIETQKTSGDLKKYSSKIKAIKESILEKAFHGELGTNNPDDEDAIELVKRILG